jgi:hypothetical protein
MNLLGEFEDFNESHSAIRKEAATEPLYHSFWSYEEIEKSLVLRNEWSILNSLIPFYGDWHDLFCFDTTSESVIELDDDRSEVYRWKSITEFRNSLIHSNDYDEPTSNTSGIIVEESHLDF